MIRKSGITRVVVEYPVEKYEIIKEYNRTHSRQVSPPKTCELALDAEVEKIKKETNGDTNDN